MRSKQANQVSANRRRREHKAQSGYALVIMLVLLIAASVYAIVDRATFLSQKNQITASSGDALQQAKEALLAFAATYSDQHSDEVFGYLPCPDRTGDGISDANLNGTECGAAGGTVVGLLPWRTLGLEDLRDAQGNCLWYAVSGNYKASASSKVTGMNWDQQAMITVRDHLGSVLAAPQSLTETSGGAAAVIFLPNQPLSTQNRVADTSVACGMSPAANPTNQFIESLTDLATAIVGQPGSTTNNDQLAWISPKEIFTRVKARKGSILPELVYSLERSRTELNNYFGTLTSLPTPANPTANGSLTYGYLPTSITALSTSALSNYLTNWRSLFRYAVCTSGTKCITVINGSPASTTLCTGALYFVGEKGATGPRTTAEVSILGESIFATTIFNNPLSSSIVISDPKVSAPATVTCLNPLPTTPPAPITTTDTFSTTQITGGGAIASTGNGSLILGSGTSNVFGCSWHPNSVTISSGFSTYFTYEIDNRGEGFVFALADATNNTSPSMCGKSGASLGYSGDNGTTTPIKPPKIGLEVDTRVTGGQQTSRGDPSSRHVGFVFWAGDSPTDDLDNVHGSSVCATAGSPCNKKATGEVFASSSIANTGVTYHVRLDIIPDTAVAQRYQLKAYITPSTLAKSYCELDDTSTVVDINSATCLARPASSLASIAATLDTTMTKAYIGFTVGQASGGASTGQVIIDNFSAQEK